MNKWDFRRLHVRDIAVIAATGLGVNLPWLWAQHFLFRPAGPVFSFLSRFALSPDALTAVVMVAYCLLFAVALFVGDRFLRRFLPHP